MQASFGAPLASYPDRVEFQIGRTIVWVWVSQALGGAAASVRRAESILGTVWDAIPQVLAVAQDASRRRLPEEWQAYDAANVADRQLLVYGIWIDPVAASAEYDVGLNHENTNSDGLPELPNDHSIQVSRDASGTVTADEPA